MNTVMLLLATYQSPLIPLETVGKDFLGLGKREVNEQAARNALPFTVIRLTESCKSPRFVRVSDLAAHIDRQAELAGISWQRSKI